MKIGMLWFDNDPKADLKIKVQRATEYYQGKYGEAPTVCYVHPCMLAGEVMFWVGKVAIRPNRTVAPNHLWVGVGAD